MDVPAGRKHYLEVQSVVNGKPIPEEEWGYCSIDDINPAVWFASEDKIKEAIPACVLLDDALFYITSKHFGAGERSSYWPQDFDSTGRPRPTRCSWGQVPLVFGQDDYVYYLVFHRFWALAGGRTFPKATLLSQTAAKKRGPKDGPEWSWGSLKMVDAEGVPMTVSEATKQLSPSLVLRTDLEYFVHHRINFHTANGGPITEASLISTETWAKDSRPEEYFAGLAPASHRSQVTLQPLHWVEDAGKLFAGCDRATALDRLHQQGVQRTESGVLKPAEHGQAWEIGVAETLHQDLVRLTRSAQGMGMLESTITRQQQTDKRLLRRRGHQDDEEEDMEVNRGVHHSSVHRDEDAGQQDDRSGGQDDPEEYGEYLENAADSAREQTGQGRRPLGGAEFTLERQIEDESSDVASRGPQTSVSRMGQETIARALARRHQSPNMIALDVDRLIKRNADEKKAMASIARSIAAAQEALQGLQAANADTVARIQTALEATTHATTSFEAQAMFRLLEARI